jgi:hypothetical protein
VEIFDASIKVETTSLFDLVHVALVTEFWHRERRPVHHDANISNLGR